MQPDGWKARVQTVYLGVVFVDVRGVKCALHAHKGGCLMYMGKRSPHITGWGSQKARTPPAPVGAQSHNGPGSRANHHVLARTSLQRASNSQLSLRQCLPHHFCAHFNIFSIQTWCSCSTACCPMKGHDSTILRTRHPPHDSVIV